MSEEDPQNKPTEGVQPPPPGSWQAPPPPGSYYRGPSPPQGSGTFDKIVPTKNPPALFAYYFALFGLIPCLGMPLSIAGLALGIVGIRKVKKNPDLPGWGHALFGIIAGAIGTLYNVPLTILAIVGLFSYRG